MISSPCSQVTFPSCFFHRKAEAESGESGTALGLLFLSLCISNVKSVQTNLMHLRKEAVKSKTAESMKCYKSAVCPLGSSHRSNKEEAFQKKTAKCHKSAVITQIGTFTVTVMGQTLSGRGEKSPPLSPDPLIGSIYVCIRPEFHYFHLENMSLYMKYYPAASLPSASAQRLYRHTHLACMCVCVPLPG